MSEKPNERQREANEHRGTNTILGILIAIVAVLVIAISYNSAEAEEPAVDAGADVQVTVSLEEELETLDENPEVDSSEDEDDVAWYQVGKRWEQFIRREAAEIEDFEMKSFEFQRAELVAMRRELEAEAERLAAAEQTNLALDAQFEDRQRLLTQEEERLHSRTSALAACVAKAMDKGGANGEG